LVLPVGTLVTTGIPISHTVSIAVDGTIRSQTVYDRTVRGALGAESVSLAPGDRVVPDLESPVTSGMQIAVIRAISIDLVVGGQSQEVRLAARTVGEALTNLGLGLHPADLVQPPVGTPLTPSLRVTVVWREWHTRVESRPIPSTSEVVNDSSLFKGHETVRSAGEAGTEDRRVDVLYADGRPVLALAGPWSIARPPVPRVVAIGTRAMIAARGAFAGREFIIFEATAYYPGPDNFGGGVGPRTAIGMIAERGVVAVDPSVIPLGTHLYIEGYGYAVAGDTGGNIQGRRIDLCYNTYQEAMQFGRRPVRVFLLDQHH
jgi:3D (Asp-Asp-Asp) domain-containing protein